MLMLFLHRLSTNTGSAQDDCLGNCQATKLTTWPPRPVFVTLVKVCSVWQASNYFFSFIESVLAISDENNMQLDSFSEEFKVRELFLYQLLLTLQLFCISKKDTKIIVFVKTLLLSGGTIEMEYSLI